MSIMSQCSLSCWYCDEGAQLQHQAGDIYTVANRALLTAATRGHVDCMRRQYEKGADNSNVALLHAADEASHECVALALAHGATNAGSALKMMVTIPVTYKINYSANRIRCAELLRAYGVPRGDVGEAFVEMVGSAGTQPDMALAEFLLEWGVDDAEFGIAHRCVNREAYRWGLIGESALSPDDGMCEADMLVKVRQVQYEIDSEGLLGPPVYGMFVSGISEHGESVTRETNAVSRFLAWMTRQHRKRIHSKLLDAAVAMSTTCLPPYVLLWITDWIIIGPLSRKERVAVLEGVRNSVRRLRGGDE